MLTFRCFQDKCQKEVTFCLLNLIIVMYPWAFQDFAVLFVDFRQTMFYYSPKLGFGLLFRLFCSIGFRDDWVDGGDDRGDQSPL